MKQKTIKKSVTIKGVGLHSGKAVTMRLKPAAANHGIRFCRTDIEDKPIIKADVDLVVEVSRGTTLEYNGVRVATVEHAMAAIAGMELDNLLIELNAEELPIKDGSAAPFIKAIEKAGLEEQDAEREYFEIEETIIYEDLDNKVEMMVMPADEFQVTCMIDFESPVLGKQHAQLEHIQDFKTEFANARTFCFLHELEQLYEANLVKGGDLNNAIVIVDREVKEEELARLRKMFNKKSVRVRPQGILDNKKLRYQNEPARHKLLDVVGDLALIGKPIKGKIIASRPGHAANIEFAKKIKALIKKSRHKVNVPYYDPNATPVYDVVQIQELLPHRFPMLLVDKVIYLDEKMVVGIKNLTANEHFFQGHFPGHPIMPGVLQIEAMAQTGGLLVMNQYPDPQNYETLFLRIEKARFKRLVVPGDTLIMKMELLRPIRRGICEMRATGFVGDFVVTEGELVAQVRKKPSAQ
ncbi:MAG: UDP-3-O-[3-hydroxymyristoyl] N-acetylglucosamine deacetylase [Limisphaerales bacterium]|jgi:UDP-3-O-[3-hydroxymyristoyl] N-acetylglucosamine deacetylase/3-hydroxyacyl-[acyl-carrier-protein] dehydratase